MFFVLFYHFSVNPRNIVEPINISRRCHLGQIVVSRFIFCNKNNLITIITAGFVFVIFTYMKLTPDDGFNFFVLFFYLSIVPINGFDEVESPHQISMICYGQSIHSIFCSGLYQLIDSRGGLQNRKLCMVMQVNKWSFLQDRTNGLIYSSRWGFFLLF